MGKIEKYTALVVQPEVYVAQTREDIYKNLERYCRLIDFGVGYRWRSNESSLLLAVKKPMAAGAKK